MAKKFGIVNPSWVKTQMEELEISSFDLISDFEITKNDFNGLMKDWESNPNEINPLGPFTFYWYFEAKRLQKQISDKQTQEEYEYK